MNLDEAIEVNKVLADAYDDGFISLFSGGIRKRIHLDGKKFKEVAQDKIVHITDHCGEYDEHYFIYEDIKFFRLVERESDSNDFKAF